MRATTRVRAVVTGALAAALMATVPPAGADTAVAAPTVTVKVTAMGRTLPNAAMKATWNGTDRGHIGELIVDGHNLPGTTTTLDALWTSKAFTTYSDIPAFEFTAKTEHTGATSASLPASIQYGVRVRPAGGAWLPWRDISVPYQSTNGVSGYLAAPRYFAPVPTKRKAQFQWRMHTELSDVSQEHQEWKVLANIP